MLLLDNFVHADLHPGNILVKFYKPTTGFILRSIISSIFNSEPPIDPVKTSEADEIVTRLNHLYKHGTPSDWTSALNHLQEEGYQPELVFLDAGLVTTLSENNRRNFLELFRSIALFDGYTAGQLMISRSSAPQLAIDPETFALKMQHLVLSVKAKTFSLGQIRISDVLTQVLRFVREHHVKMEGDFVNTVISVLLLEGIGRQLDPDMDLFKSALPIFRRLGRQVTAKDAIADINQEGTRGSTGAMIKVSDNLELWNVIWVSDDLIVLGVARGARTDQCRRY
jgi:aarF domain-containing kinase